MKFKQCITVIIFGICMQHNVAAQKQLSPMETQWINEADKGLTEAISNPGMNEKVRLELVQKAARTRKQYGQPPFDFPTKIPLRELMEKNYNENRNYVLNANRLYQVLNEDLLNQKLKLVNKMQIEVTGQQIQFLIPGSTPIDLTCEAISTVFQYDFVGGASGGKRSDAIELKKKFMKLAETKELINKLVELQKYQKISMENLDKDLDGLPELEKKIFKSYSDAEKSISVFKGYENSVMQDVNSSSENNSDILGTWVFNAPGFNVVHRYFSDGTATIRVNATENRFRWKTSGQLITYYYENGKTYTQGYEVKGNQLYYCTKKLKRAGHPLTRQ